MNIRQAILAAANSIEKNPKMFAFESCVIPDCGSQGCALGWIGFHLGLSANFISLGVSVCPVLGVKTAAFHELTKLYGSFDWQHSAPDCAKALRLYANKFHPVQNNVPMSTWKECPWQPEKVNVLAQ